MSLDEAWPERMQTLRNKSLDEAWPQRMQTLRNKSFEFGLSSEDADPQKQVL